MSDLTVIRRIYFNVMMANTFISLFKKLILAFLSIIFLLLFNVEGVIALPDVSFFYGEKGQEIVSNSSKDKEIKTYRLQEISPPIIAQKITKDLAKYNPKINFISPNKDEILQSQEWELSLDIYDWPISPTSEFGLGPNVVIQLDQNPLIKISEIEGNNVRIPMPALSPGSHIILAYAAYPWGEAVKKTGSSQYMILNSYKELDGILPKNNDIWITPIVSENLSKDDPYLIDYLVWNAPLQGLTEGDGKWMVKITVNSESFLSYNQEAIWIEPSKKGFNLIQFELLDRKGFPIQPVFNNKLIVVDSNSIEEPLIKDYKTIEEETDLSIQ